MRAYGELDAIVVTICNYGALCILLDCSQSLDGVDPILT
jgi:hypothetical protein